MPVITVSPLPRQGEEQLKELFDHIIAVAVSVEELGLKGAEDITVRFPVDMMEYRLGLDIIVEIDYLFRKEERTEEVCNRLAQRLGEVVKVHFPNAKVEAFVKPFNPAQGFWSSAA